jgi:hypothetical protein
MGAVLQAEINIGPAHPCEAVPRLKGAVYRGQRLFELHEAIAGHRSQQGFFGCEVVVGGPGGDAGILGDASQGQNFPTGDALERMAKQRLFKLTVVLSHFSHARSPWHGVR